MRHGPMIEKLVRRTLRADHKSCASSGLESAHSSSLGANLERKVCTELFECIRLSPKRHFAKLDNVLKRYLQLHLCDTESDLAWSASLLSRLPSVPASTVKLHRPYSDLSWDTQWKTVYALPKSCNVSEDSINSGELTETAKRRSQTIKSCRLKVARYLNSNTILTALGLSAHSGSSSKIKTLKLRKLVEYTNWLSSLTEEAVTVDVYIMGSQHPYGPAPNSWASKHLGLDNFSDSPAKSQSPDVVILFLWTAWQRSIMLLLYYNINSRLYQQEAEDPLANLSIGGNIMLNCYLRSDLLEEHQIPQYMCPWALSLIRSRRSNAGLDIRRLLCRYQTQFGDHPPRCIVASRQQCKGSSPEECERFLTRRPEEQHFAHDEYCDAQKCERIQWDETSYRNSPSPRAVRVQLDSGKQRCRLSYCQAGSRTIAVSHVWSHGQGGRPEDGMNLCLHRRYCKLAEKHHCDSYWIDTACIPNDKVLRTEAIRKINTVFQDSKITLICDKDLMAIDIPNVTDLVRWETIMATLLVCDWNIRAWTLLEAVKGKRRLYILTKSNHAVNFLDGALLLTRSGPLDLVASLSAADHLLPSPSPTTQTMTSFEEVGHVLSHRHASREGDDIAIWSLLSTGRYHDTMPGLLLDIQTVRTGFLMSSSPRCVAEGFGWAPQTPRLRTIKGTVYPIRPDPFESHYPVKIYHSYDGKGSLVGTVSMAGFKACWLVLMLRHESDLQALAPWNEDFGHEMWEHVITLFQTYKSVALLRALEEEGQRPWKASDQQGQEAGSKIVVCASSIVDRWEWKGVFAAPNGIEGGESDGDGAEVSETKYIWQVMELILV